LCEVKFSEKWVGGCYKLDSVGKKGVMVLHSANDRVTNHVIPFVKKVARESFRNIEVVTMEEFIDAYA
jgi:hypothetical protein